MKTIISCAFLALFASAAFAEELTAAQIMERVAENQDRSVAARARWTHHQDVLVRLTRSNGSLVRQEHREFTVLPTADGIKKELVRSETTPPPADKEGMDAEMARDLSNDFANETKSRDGIHRKMFPFTRDEQSKYDFRLLGKESYRGRDVWRIGFAPAKGNPEAVWAGDALIDVVEFQPVSVTTKLGLKLPVAVKIMFGVNIGYMGFKVNYRKLEDGVWMPETYGGEFSVRAFFFYNRRVGISMRNSDFRVADVRSTIDFASSTITAR